MGVVYFSIIPTFEPSRYCKCWIVCFYNTPELPVVSCYEVDTKKKAFLKCVVRADDFVTEYTNENSPESATEIKKMFDKFYETKTNLVTPEDVIDFLKNPMKYPLF